MPKFNKPFFREMNFDLLLLVTFFTGITLIIASYAWFSSSLNVKVDFFNIVASNQTGLTISLDAVNYGSTVEVSRDKVIYDLKNLYPNHRNQWTDRGMHPVSSNGIQTSNDNGFRMFTSTRLGYKINATSRKRYLNTIQLEENESNPDNIFIAFDLFLKNVTGSPNPDNLFLDRGTSALLASDKYSDADGVINSMRFGFLKLGSVPLNSEPSLIQNKTCDNACEMVIYEPNSNYHSPGSITRARGYGIRLINGTYRPTYAVINEGKYLDLINGQAGTGVPLNTRYFAPQRTVTNFARPLFQIPDGVTKVRVYVWLEGQDIDSLETTSKGTAVVLAINFIKDFAGYE